MYKYVAMRYRIYTGICVIFCVLVVGARFLPLRSVTVQDECKHFGSAEKKDTVRLSVLKGEYPIMDSLPESSCGADVVYRLYFW